MTRSHIAAVAIPLLLTACSVTIPVDVSTEVAFQGPAGSFQVAQPVDLSGQGELWSKRTQVDSISVDEVVVSVVALGAGHQASSVSLTLAFRPEGAPSDGSQDVVLPAITDLAFTVGASARVPGSARLEAVLHQALQGSGRFQVVTSGTLSGLASATMKVAVKGSAVYSTGK
jgi:hypothetical protein